MVRSAHRSRVYPRSAPLMRRSAEADLRARLEPWAACTAPAGRPARSRSSELRAELLAKDAISLGRDGDGARAVDATYPALREALAANFRAERPREMRPALAPIEARPAQDAYRPASATLSQRRDVDTHPAEQGDAGIGDHTAVAREFRMAARNQRVRERDAEASRQVVVAGARRPRGRVARPDEKFRPRRAEVRGHAHDALHHLRHRGRRETVVVVTALLLDAQQPGRHHAGEMAGCGLRRDAGDARQFGG